MSHFARAAAVLLTLGTAACNSGGTGALSSQPARRLGAAARRMRTAPSFGFTAEVTAGDRVVKLVGEFAAPDRIHETITPAGAPSTEVILIGNAAYRLTATPGKWTTPTQRPPAQQGDPRAAFVALTRATHVTSAGGRYRFEVVGNGAHILAGPKATRVRGTAVVTGGALTELEYQADDPLHTRTHLTYSQVGSAPPVTAPSAG